MKGAFSMATTNINVRVDTELKQSAEELFSDLGLNMSTAITMFLKSAVSHDGIPFEIKRMTPNAEKIKNSRELEFVVFCIENVAAKLGVGAERVYQAFTEKSDILNSYIVPEYEVLHTQSREYIVDDLLSVLKERGVEV